LRIDRGDSLTVDLPVHYYEPGGRKFESCWAHSKSFVPNDLKKKKEKSAQSWRAP
jgi:hypothetical protein